MIYCIRVPVRFPIDASRDSRNSFERLWEGKEKFEDVIDTTERFNRGIAPTDQGIPNSHISRLSIPIRVSNCLGWDYIREYHLEGCLEDFSLRGWCRIWG